MKLIFLLEEPSMKAFLDVLLPRIIPKGVSFQTVSHEGKTDLKRSIPRKLAGWNEPNIKFIILHDNDEKDCLKLKKELVDLCEGFNKEVLVRIPCQELEAWYFGDMEAISRAYGKDLKQFIRRSKYRIPDLIPNPKEELKRIIPQHQQILGAKKIANNMDIDRNTSTSFRVFIEGINKMLKNNYSGEESGEMA